MVVETASRVEYPTITTGGAGVARAERMSTGNGRWADQRSAAPTTWMVTTRSRQTTAENSYDVGRPARSDASRTVASEATSRNSAST